MKMFPRFAPAGYDAVAADARRQQQIDRESRLAQVALGSYVAGMRAVGVKLLKNKLSEYVRLAAGGETVLVTDRDRVVAELGPPQPGRADEIGDAMLANAVREGWITPPLAPDKTPPPRRPIATWRKLASGLESDRSDR